jgi:flagellar protein FliO/FliZ
MRLPTPIRGAAYACATSLLLALAGAGPAFAAGAPAPSDSFEHKALHLTSGTPTHTSSGSFSGSIVRTIVGLAVVIAVIYGLTWVIRQSRSAKHTAVGEGLAQVALLPLGTGRSVALVRVGDELHLLGVAEGGVTPIRAFSEDEAYELGIPFRSDDDDLGARGPVPLQRIVDSLRRLTIR